MQMMRALRDAEGGGLKVHSIEIKFGVCWSRERAMFVHDDFESKISRDWNYFRLVITNAVVEHS